MIAKLEFNLPEDKEDFKTASNAWAYRLALEEFDGWLRNQIKYLDKNELQEVRDQLREICRDNDIND